MAFETILYETRDNYAEITLNRPDRLNSFTGQMLADLNAGYDQAEADGARAILLTGAGRAFSAGQDLNERERPTETSRPDLRVFLRERYNPMVRRMRAMRLPIVCAINGVAAGAGLGIALASDILVAGRSASFLQAFIRLGLVPDAGNTYFLPRLVGMAKARAMAMLGEPIPAEQAEAWGLIWKCVDDDVLMTETRALAARLAAAPTQGLALTKQAFDRSLHNDLAAQLDLERDLQYQAGHTDDYLEGVTAFLEKRKPIYKGE